MKVVYYSHAHIHFKIHFKCNRLPRPLLCTSAPDDRLFGVTIRAAPHGLLAYDWPPDTRPCRPGLAAIYTLG